MHITQIFINGFSSFQDFKIELEKQENIIVGTNGSGKTNFLEILYNTISSLTNHKIYDIFAKCISSYTNNNVEIQINISNEEAIFLQTFHIFVLLANNINTDIKYNEI